MQIADTEASTKMGIYADEDTSLDFEDLIEVGLLDPELDWELTERNESGLRVSDLSDEGKASYIAKARDKMKSLASYLLREVPLVSQEAHIEDALDSLIRNYIAIDLEFKYDLIHPDLFKLERIIKTTQDGREFKAVIPTFAHAKFGEDSWGYDSDKENDRYRERISVYSEAPPIIKRAKESAKEFARDYFESTSKALKEEVIGDLMLRSNRHFQEPPNFEMYWIPLPTELKIEVEVIDKDPILIAHNLERNFLVSQWEVEGEQPFEHYLKEFNEERLADMGYSIRPR